MFSRNGHEFKQWPSLNREIAGSVRCRSALLGGEIVCLNADSRSNFYALLFRRRAPFFCAFDALEINGQDLRGLPLLERKHRLFDVMPPIESRVRSVDYIRAWRRVVCPGVCARPGGSCSNPKLIVSSTAIGETGLRSPGTSAIGIRWVG